VCEKHTTLILKVKVIEIALGKLNQRIQRFFLCNDGANIDIRSDFCSVHCLNCVLRRAFQSASYRPYLSAIENLSIGVTTPVQPNLKGGANKRSMIGRID